MKDTLKMIGAIVLALLLTLVLVVPSFTQVIGQGAKFLFDTVTGALKVYVVTLIGGEHVDPVEANGYVRTVGGILRTTQLVGTGGIPTTATDATSATFSLPMNTAITFHGVETCTGTCTQVQSIYGTSINNTTVATSQLLGTITLNNTTNANATLTVTTKWPYVFVVTSGTGGTTPLALLNATY